MAQTEATYCAVCETDLAENDWRHQDGCFAADYGVPLVEGQGDVGSGDDACGS